MKTSSKALVYQSRDLLINWASREHHRRRGLRQPELYSRVADALRRDAAGESMGDALVALADEVEGANNGDEAPPTPLTATEYQILQQLARQRPQLATIIDLAADLNCNRDTASEAVRHLEELGFVDRPNGKRKGVRIKTPAVAALRPCDRPKSS